MILRLTEMNFTEGTCLPLLSCLSLPPPGLTLDQSCSLSYFYFNDSVVKRGRVLLKLLSSLLFCECVCCSVRWSVCVCFVVVCVVGLEESLIRKSVCHFKKGESAAFCQSVSVKMNHSNVKASSSCCCLSER